LKLYKYSKKYISYIRYKLFTLKNVIIFSFIQVCLTISLLFVLSTFYNTPKEKKLKEDIIYLVNEFDQVNQRIISAEAQLEKIKENDSIIYQSIFETFEEVTRKNFNVYYEGKIKNNDYSDIVENINIRLTKLDEDVAKQLYNLNTLVRKAYNHADMLSAIPAIQPIDNKNLKRTGSGWGYRIHPIYKIRRFHYGLDFVANIGTPIYATGNARVQYVINNLDKSSQGYGNLIILDHGYGYKTLYAHLSKFNVKAGQEVKRGEIIGYVGSTGLSTGPHLHYEVIKNGRKVNPIHYLFYELTPEEYAKIIEISNSIKKSYD